MSNDSHSLKRFAGWIGLGLLFMWSGALLFWIDLASEYGTWRKVLGYGGAAVTSLAGIAAALYASHLEKRAASLDAQLRAERDAAAFLRR
jgi:hypothetical protein